MKIFLENVDLNSNTGPNSFAQKLTKYMTKMGCEFTKDAESDIFLCFIESFRHDIAKKPTIQRMDGIYFNASQNYEKQNSNILRTYKNSTGIVFQSEFNKDLIFKWFGECDSYRIIHNGADVDLIAKIPPLKGSFVEKYDTVWSCASNWRPHKRLHDNIRYFLEHSGNNDVLLVCGEVRDRPVNDSKIKYLGNLSMEKLISVYKSSRYFLHLAWLDHCPNVVIDARASGCEVICSSTGGTKEIAGPKATILEERRWDFKPVDLYSPPDIDFTKKMHAGKYDSEYDMNNVAQKYHSFFTSVIN